MHNKLGQGSVILCNIHSITSYTETKCTKSITLEQKSFLFSNYWQNIPSLIYKFDNQMHCNNLFIEYTTGTTMSSTSAASTAPTSTPTFSTSVSTTPGNTTTSDATTTPTTTGTVTTEVKHLLNIHNYRQNLNSVYTTCMCLFHHFESICFVKVEPKFVVFIHVTKVFARSVSFDLKLYCLCFSLRLPARRVPVL